MSKDAQRLNNSLNTIIENTKGMTLNQSDTEVIIDTINKLKLQIIRQFEHSQSRKIQELKLEIECLKIDKMIIDINDLK